MKTIHAGLLEDKLLIWGEESAPSTQTAASGKKTSSKKASAAAAHPYASTHAELIKIFAENSVIDVSPRELPACQALAVATLPVVHGGPSHSSSLGETPSGFKQFTVPVLVLDPELAMTAVANFVGKRMLAPGVVLGAELAVVVQLVRLAMRIVINQQFLPSANRTVTKSGARKKVEEEQFIAEWKPVFSNTDVTFLQTTVRNMPAILRALSIAGDGTAAPPLLNSLTVAQNYVVGLVDYLVRTSADSTDLRPFADASEQKHSSVHDAWIAALTSWSSKRIVFDRDECAKLCRQIADWQKPIVSLRSSPFRLCFRLDEPRGDDDDEIIPAKPGAADWQISYHLQSRQDQSLIVPVNEIWRGTKSTNSILNRSGFNAREYLLLSLGHAAKLYPLVERSLRSTAPSHHDLDSQNTFDFLKDKSSLLEDAGFGVLLPSWWSSGKAKKQLKIKAKAKSSTLKSKSELGLERIIQFDYQAALGDQILTLKELQAIAKLKTPLVKVRGQWVHIDPDQLAKAIKHWETKKETITVKGLIELAIGAKQDISDLTIDGVEAEGWIADMLQQLEDPSAVKQLPPPAKLQAQLRPYQLRGYSWLSFLKRWGLGACLADDMGLGKTIQTLAMIQKERETESASKPVLLVCPTSVVNNWLKEAERFTPSLKLMVHHGAGRSKEAKFKQAAEQSDIVISSYSLLHRDLAHLREVEWNGLVLDEAQNIKNAETKQAKAAKAIQCNYRVALTGTPVENNVGDLWSIMDFLNPGFLGNQNAFRKNFFFPIQMTGDVEAQERLKRITQPFILRRLKTDRSIITDLPEKQESKVYCQLTKEQASLYAAVLKDMQDKLEDAEGMQRRGLVLATLSKLKQVCNHPAQFLGDNSPVPGRSGKLARLTEIMDEILQEKDKVLIFSQFVEMGDLLKPYLEDQFGYPVLFLHGGVVKKKRDEMVEQFQNDAGLPIFLLSIKAGGTGLNLTQANHVIHFDRWWNPAVENQATDRAFRIGQKKNVQVHKFVCTGTLEEKIDDMIEQKQKLATDVISAGESWLTELSNQELKQVFALSKEALAE
jgi:SNF2 family DNA or RNA helicase